MRVVPRFAALTLPPALAVMALMGCGKSPTAPKVIALAAGQVCPQGFICTTTSRDGKVEGPVIGKPGLGKGNGGSSSGSGSNGCTGGVSTFQSCTAYPAGARVSFRGVIYVSVDPISADQDCPPDSPLNPQNDSSWEPDSSC